MHKSKTHNLKKRKQKIEKKNEKENLQKANGRLFGIELITNNFLGAPIAGFLIGISLITPFIADTLLLIFSSFFIFKIKGNFKRENNSNSGQKTIPMIKDGITWLKSQSLLKRLAIYTGLANFLGACHALELFLVHISVLVHVEDPECCFGHIVPLLITLVGHSGKLFKKVCCF